MLTNYPEVINGIALIAQSAATVQTVGNVQVDVLSVVVPNGETTYQLVLEGDESPIGVNVYNYIRYVTAKNSGTGASITGTATNAHTAEANNPADIVVTFSANNMNLRANGVAGRTINWRGKILRVGSPQ
jgi:hypothetical protein